MAVTDFTFDYVNKILDNPSGSTVESVNAVYSYIQDTFDELTQLDDDMPMSAQTPTSYTMINGWYITERATRLLDGGAIQTNGYNNEVQVLTLDGTYTNFVEADRGKQLRDDAVDVGAVLDFDNTAQKVWFRKGDATLVADNSAITVNGGVGAGDAAGAGATGETIFANPYTLGTLNTSNGTPALYIYQNGSEYTSFWPAGQFDILIKVAEAGVDIDSRKIQVFGRNWSDTYTWFEITLTTAGQNAVPLGTENDLNVTSSEAAVQAIADTNIGGDLGTGIDVNVSLGGYSYDIGDGNGNQTYDVQVDCNNQTLDNVYEVLKWLTRDGATQIIPGQAGTEGQEYISANPGVYANVVSSPFGTFAGGKLFGARGVYFVNLNAADAQNFQLIDAAGVTRDPPNFQAFGVNGSISGDNVAVYEDTSQDAGVVKKNQYTLNGSNPLNQIVVNETIPTSTPTSGTIIVVDTDGTETVYAYTAFSGSTFTVTVGAGTHDGTETAFVPYIYELSTGSNIAETSTVYTSDIPVVAIVRQKGYIPFKITGTYGSGGYTASAIRTVDGIYTP